MDGIRKEHNLACIECDGIEKEIDKLNKAIEELRQLYDKANVAQQDAFAAVRELKKQETSKVRSIVVCHDDDFGLFMEYCVWMVDLLYAIIRFLDV